jgi:adenine-specific DNA-methyltransferase
MPTLNWIGKEAVAKHDSAVPFRLLEPVAELSCGDADNLIVQGDNLHALKTLLPRYAGKVIIEPQLDEFLRYSRALLLLDAAQS